MTRDEISDRTGFDNGDRFASDDDVRAYFTPDVQREMFGDDAVTDLAILAPPAGVFAYDYFNRMVEFTDANTNQRHTYTYDCFGRLLKKVVDADGTPVETRYIYSGWQVVEEQDANSATQATYVYGRYVDEVVTMRRGGNDYYMLRDDQYNVLGLMDSSGALVEAYDYDDYGMPLDDATRQPLTASALGNPCFFTGRRWHPELGLYNYRTRWYDPVSGRFTTRDSIGIWGDANNLGNAFAYVGNNPWGRVDPNGRWAAIAYSILLGAVMKGAEEVQNQYSIHGSNWKKWDYSRILAAITAGAISGLAAVVGAKYLVSATKITTRILKASGAGAVAVGYGVDGTNFVDDLITTADNVLKGCLVAGFVVADYIWNYQTYGHDSVSNVHEVYGGVGPR